MNVELLSDIASFTHDPLACILYCFPWNEGPLAGISGPRQWQREELEAVKAHLSDPATRFTPYYSAVVSGNGPGKSALVAMLTKWALSTCDDCRVIITANTGAQLSSKTQPEVAKWFRMALDHDYWDIQATQIRAKDAIHRDTYRCDFQTWNEANPEAIGGLHNLGKRIVIIFDEASAIPRTIWEYIKGALTDANTEILWFAFGNGTLNEGPFYECFNKNAHIWKTRHIDTRDIPGTNKEEIARWIDEDGIDSDWVRVHVRGLFPMQSELQFISHALVNAARHYHATGYDDLPRVLACDVARFGSDETVFGLRQGRKYVEIEKYRRQDTQFTGARLIEHIKKYKPDAVVVDADGIGGAVVDYCVSLGYGDIHGFNGGGQAYDQRKYGNRRAEIWAKGRFWLENGAEIPEQGDGPDSLAHQLTAPHFYYRSGQTGFGALMLERKEDMKKRGERSPDRADAMMLTFAVDPAPKVEDNSRDKSYAALPRGPQSWLGA